MARAILIRNCTIPNPNAPPYVILHKDVNNIGRHSEIMMDTSRGKEVSKLHTKISRKLMNEQFVWIIEDNKSLNGTFVNGRKIKCVVLKPFDEVVFGGGPTYVVGDIVNSTDAAECRYLFFQLPPSVHYRADINMLHTEESISSEMCPICYSPIMGCETLPCGHNFCFTCLQEWSHVCTKKLQPCLCPMCRAPYSQSELDRKEYTLTNEELKITFIEPLLHLINASCCKEIRGNSIFTLWSEKQKEWFWDSYNIVKNNDIRKLPFLDLTRATYKYIIQASAKQLSYAITNLDGIPQITREEMLCEVLKLVYTKFTRPPDARKLRTLKSSQLNLYWLNC